MEELSKTFHALADPTRRAILERLSKGSASVSEISEPFDMSMPAITKHLKVLENAGLIKKTVRAQFRTCTINGTPLKKAMSWIEEYRQFWEERFDQLEEYLKQIEQDSTKTSKKRKKNGK